MVCLVQRQLFGLFKSPPFYPVKERVVGLETAVPFPTLSAYATLQAGLVRVGNGRILFAPTHCSANGRSFKSHVAKMPINNTKDS